MRLPISPSPGTKVRLVAVCARAVCLGGLKELAGNCRGAVAVEFLILLFPMMLMLFGIFDIGMAMLTETRINFAAEAAAKCGAINAPMCGSPSQTAAYGASIAAAGPQCVGVLGHYGCLWNLRNYNLPLRWCGDTADYPERRGLLPRRVSAAG